MIRLYYRLLYLRILEVGFTLSQATKTLRDSRRTALFLFLTSALEGGEGSASRPDSTLPAGKTRYPLYRRLGGPQGRSGQVRKISPPPGFDSRTVQPVGSRYTDYATRPNIHILYTQYIDAWGGVVVKTLRY